MKRLLGRDLEVGKRYWLDTGLDISGELVSIDKNDTIWSGIQGKELYTLSSEGTVKLERDSGFYEINK